MDKSVIRVENLSKAYQIGQIGTGTISRDLERFFVTKVLGKEDPFLKIGETNDRSSKGQSDIVWSLKDINFEINQGDAVGIIGKNGAGKSTLLKLLSRVTSPTTGEIKVKGRIASLLEVGTGFHPELSGRENIYLNGAILGMRKKEITRKLEEIINFSGVERYIDTPVKRYSSGMYVRLAFAVAAHLESEILIVDEVLAVGDAEFQKKCLGKMGEISKGEGRTVLFVSHNMAAVKSLCTKGILLANGCVSINDSITSVVNKYEKINLQSIDSIYVGKKIIKKIYLQNNNINYNSTLNLVVEFESRVPLTDVVLGIVIKDSYDIPIVGINNKHYQIEKINSDSLNNGNILLQIDEIKLLPGDYKLDVFLGDTNKDIESVLDALSFRIIEIPLIEKFYKLDTKLNKTLHFDVKWKIEI